MQTTLLIGALNISLLIFRRRYSNKLNELHFYFTQLRHTFKRFFSSQNLKAFQRVEYELTDGTAVFVYYQFTYEFQCSGLHVKVVFSNFYLNFQFTS